MGAYYWSTWLADALRSDPFIADRVVEVDGWRTRGRPPAQFSYLPSGVLDHHTACMCNVGHDPASCLRQIIAGNASAPGPIAQVLESMTPTGVRYDGTNCDPRIYVIAAGRSNHAGAGVWPWGAPEGNGSAIGIEACGPAADGWPDLMIEVRARVSAAILRHNGWPIERLTTHNEYARPSGRKIDPSGAWPLEPDLGRLQPWSAATWRHHVARFLVPAPPAPDPEVEPFPTPTPPEEDDMPKNFLVVDSRDGAYYVTDMATFKTPVNNGEQAGDDVRVFGVVGRLDDAGNVQPIPVGRHYDERIDRLPTVGS